MLKMILFAFMFAFGSWKSTLSCTVDRYKVCMLLLSLLLLLEQLHEWHKYFVVRYLALFWRRYLTFCIFMALICRLYANFQHTHIQYSPIPTHSLFLSLARSFSLSICFLTHFPEFMHLIRFSMKTPEICRFFVERSECKMKRRDRGKSKWFFLHNRQFLRMKTLCFRRFRKRLSEMKKKLKL